MIDSYLKQTVCDIIVPAGYCVGCGICAGICPVNALDMKWNERGCFEAMIDRAKCIHCSKCLKACPFFNENMDETAHAVKRFGPVQNYLFDQVIGFYLCLLEGWVTDSRHRFDASSGGVTSWLAAELLQTKKVKSVCAVRPVDGSIRGRLFEYFIADSPEDIWQSGKSAYYPIEISEVIQKLKEMSEDFAVIGLPCLLKGLCNVLNMDNELRKRCKFLIGIFCGQQKNKYFAEYCARLGGAAGDIIKARFRVKEKSYHHLNHKLEFSYLKDGQQLTGCTFQDEGMARIWGLDCFKINACNYCDDITAETADVSIGDAVSGKNASKGANYIIVRNHEIKDLLDKGHKQQRLSVNKTQLKKVKKRLSGCVKIKRSDLSHRLYCQKKNDRAYMIRKRCKAHFRKNIFLNKDLELRSILQDKSTLLYSNFIKGFISFEQVESKINEIVEDFHRKNLLYLLMLKFINLPGKVKKIFYIW